MEHYTIETKTESFTRVNKAYARKHYKTELIAMCPVKLRPGWPWAPHMYLTQADLEPTYDGDTRHTFDGQVDSFIYYNCNANKVGYYPAFYKVTKHSLTGDMHHEQRPQDYIRAVGQGSTNYR